MKKVTLNLLYMRILVGCFLLYLAYSLVSDLSSGSTRDKIIWFVAAVIFTAVGVGGILFSIKRIVKKEYEDFNTSSQKEDISTEDISTDNIAESDQDVENQTDEK